ncbi:MAG: hypothetical protein VX100_06105 [Pseudomonadota bacterium]|nr:hypothetical protein [Pseudomonadota bacterium]
MNLNKGLVALAVTGALASPIAANAAATLVTYGGKSGIQAGPQATTGSFDNGVVYGIRYSTGSGTSLVVTGASDHVTIDKIYVKDDNDGKKENLVVDYDAGENNTPAGTDFPGSVRTDVSIAYTADVTVPNEGTFTIEFSGAAGGLDPATAPNLVFVAQVARPGTNTTYVSGDFVTIGSVIDYNLNAERNVVDSITVQVDTNRPELAGLQFVLADNDKFSGTNGVEPVWDANSAGVDYSKDPFQTADAIPAHTQIFLASPGENDGEYNPIKVSAEEGSKVGDFIRAEVTEVKNTSGIVLNALANNEQVAVAEIVDGFALNVIDQATTTINVEADRLSFIHDDAADEVGVNNLTSTALLQLQNKADYGVELSPTDTLSMDFARKDGESIKGVKSITFGATGLSKASGSDDFDLAATALNTLGLYTGSYNYNVTPFVIEVDGKNFLEQNKENPSDWVASGVELKTSAGDFDVPVVYAETGTYVDGNSVAENGATHVWPVNGAQFKIPYIYSINTTTGFGSSVKIVNEFAQEGDVFVDAVVAPAGLGQGVLKDEQPRTIKNVLLGTVPGEGHFTQTGDQIAELLELDMAKNWHIELTYLVNAPQNKVHAAAQNKDRNGRADTPVLYKTNNTGGTIKLSCTDATVGGVSPDTCEGTLVGGDKRQWQ